MKQIKLIFLLVVLTSVISFSQDYKSAVGGKLGYGLIGTYKMFLNEKSAIDVFGGIRWGGLAAGAYYLIHTPVKSVENLKWYWGLGGSITTWNYGFAGYSSYYELGASGVIGLDYTIKDYPVNVSVDWAPTFVVADSYDYPFGNLNRFRAGYGAVSVRYILNPKR